MAQDTPFGQATRMRVLEDYFAQAGEITAENAWEHVYHCLLWMNLGTGLAHVYDSNHMQAGGVFHDRAVRFTGLLCKNWNVSRSELPARVDYLFKGCIAELKRRGPAALIDSELESELTAAVSALLKNAGLAEATAAALSREIERLSRDFFTIGNKRKNALGEGFEDLLFLLLQRVSRIPEEHISLRKSVSKLPGFRGAPARRPDGRRERQPHPDSGEKGASRERL